MENNRENHYLDTSLAIGPSMSVTLDTSQILTMPDPSSYTLDSRYEIQAQHTPQLDTQARVYGQLHQTLDSQYPVHQISNACFDTQQEITSPSCHYFPCSYLVQEDACNLLDTGQNVYVGMLTQCLDQDYRITNQADPVSLQTTQTIFRVIQTMDHPIQTEDSCPWV